MATATTTPAKLPLDQRHSAIRRFESDDDECGELAYPINYDELYNLKGRLLTIIDANLHGSAAAKGAEGRVLAGTSVVDGRHRACGGMLSRSGRRAESSRVADLGRRVSRAGQ